MARRLGLIPLLMLSLGFAARLTAASAPPNAQEVEFFETKVRPLLAEHCFSCHGPDKQKSGLRLDSAQGLKLGGDTGPVVVPGKPAESLLVQAIRYAGELKMPPKGKLPADAIGTLEEWIRRGAVFPDATSAPQPLAWRAHWAFQPIVKPATPRLFDPWLKGPIDAFVLAKLRETTPGGGPAPRADRRTLLRRATYDLHGLPATYEEVEAFLSDPQADDTAWADQVDRLLASPRFGERWGRHWLDLARYADDQGYIGVGVDRSYPFAYTYRDWVIRSFNDDLPYDRFIKFQIAADQLIKDEDNPAPLAAMGFLTVGRRFIGNLHDIIDDRIDVVMRTTMGLTVSCARCHDHKYDPISAQDYYALYGVFGSSREPAELPLLVKEPGGPEYEAYVQERGKLEAELAEFDRTHEKDRKEKPIQVEEQRKPFVNKIKQLEVRHPGAPPRGMVMEDHARAMQPVVFLRGQPHNRGPTVPRRFVSFLCDGEPKPFKRGSGRLELAEAIVAPSNPLTARVWVNRVWGHLFGRGLVRTPSDFGMRSEPPTHPELLDHLAHQFMEDGWSTKRLIRRILLSSSYQQSSSVRADQMEADAENRLLGRMNRKRLDLEGMRDAMLSASGQLDLTLGGRSVEIFGNPKATRRTVYGLIDRQNLPGLLRTFDFAVPDTHSPQRFTTTVPQQALYLLNSPFVLSQAEALLARAGADGAPGERLVRLCRLTWARLPTEAEEKRLLNFLSVPAPEQEKAWLQVAQVLLVSDEFQFVD
jgi:hypothetical protein